MIDSKKLKKQLEEKFGYSSFRPGQEETVAAAISNYDTLVMLPTGTGKSICYQLAGYFKAGKVIIVSPLVSLMQDQVEQLKSTGEKRVAALNSLLTSREKKSILDHLDYYKFIYLSPEMLQQNHVLSELKKLTVALFVVDEAHCISQWGMDFRTEYLQLGHIRNELNNPTTMALTATATKKVREEIISSLNFIENETIQIVHSVDRPNIALSTVMCKSNKETEILKTIHYLKPPGIIYFSSKSTADSFAQKINKETSLSSMSYHSEIDSDDKIKIQQQFIQDKIDIICATSAFGMGINKNNIRYVLHYHLPGSPEEYLQAIGRAGRDGKESVAIVFYEKNDYFIQQSFQEKALPTKSMLEEAYRQITPNFSAGNEMQAQMINYFLSEKIDKEEAYRRILERKRTKESQLTQMIYYCETRECKRQFLLHYFDEFEKRKDINCCSSCGIDWSPYKKEENKVGENKETAPKNWQDKVNDLFLFPNF